MKRPRPKQKPHQKSKDRTEYLRDFLRDITRVIRDDPAPVSLTTRNGEHFLGAVDAILSVPRANILSSKIDVFYFPEDAADLSPDHLLFRQLHVTELERAEFLGKYASGHQISKVRAALVSAKLVREMRLRLELASLVLDRVKGSLRVAR